MTLSLANNLVPIVLAFTLRLNGLSVIFIFFSSISKLLSIFLILFEICSFNLFVSMPIKVR